MLVDSITVGFSPILYSGRASELLSLQSIFPVIRAVLNVPSFYFKMSEFWIIRKYGVDLVIANVEYTFVLFGLPCVFLVCFCICYLQPMIPTKRFDICSP